jgi:hypothetical protein
MPRKREKENEEDEEDEEDEDVEEKKGRRSTEVDTCSSLHVLNEYARPHHTTPACPDVKPQEEEDAAEVVRDSFVRVV